MYITEYSPNELTNGGNVFIVINAKKLIDVIHIVVPTSRIWKMEEIRLYPTSFGLRWQFSIVTLCGMISARTTNGNGLLFNKNDFFFVKKNQFHQLLSLLTLFQCWLRTNTPKWPTVVSSWIGSSRCHEHLSMKTFPAQLTIVQHQKPMQLIEFCVQYDLQVLKMCRLPGLGWHQQSSYTSSDLGLWFRIIRFINPIFKTLPRTLHGNVIVKFTWTRIAENCCGITDHDKASTT